MMLKEFLNFFRNNLFEQYINILQIEKRIYETCSIRVEEVLYE